MNKNLLAAIIMSAEALLLFVVVLPQFDRWSSAREALGQRTQLLTDATAAQANIVKLNQTYTAQKTSIDKILIALPPKQHIDYLTSSIHSAAQQSGLELKSINFGNAAVGKGEYRAIQIRLELAGRYPALLAMLGNLEQSVRLYDVARVQVSELSGSDGTLAINLDLIAYSLK
ncbi:MAG: type 4a pilus biogenesis protein PilO [bacterium]|nr:type 4a pilus biogenesis protein PilO [bacterium]